MRKVLSPSWFVQLILKNKKDKKIHETFPWTFEAQDGEKLSSVLLDDPDRNIRAYTQCLLSQKHTLIPTRYLHAKWIWSGEKEWIDCTIAEWQKLHEKNEDKAHGIKQIWIFDGQTIENFLQKDRKGWQKNVLIVNVWKSRQEFWEKT